MGAGVPGAVAEGAGVCAAAVAASRWGARCGGDEGGGGAERPDGRGAVLGAAVVEFGGQVFGVGEGAAADEFVGGAEGA